MIQSEISIVRALFKFKDRDNADMYVLYIQKNCKFKIGWIALKFIKLFYFNTYVLHFTALQFKSSSIMTELNSLRFSFKNTVKDIICNTDTNSSFSEKYDSIHFFQINSGQSSFHTHCPKMSNWRREVTEVTLGCQPLLTHQGFF